MVTCQESFYSYEKISFAKNKETESLFDSNSRFVFLEAYLEPSQTSTMGIFAKIVDI